MRNTKKILSLFLSFSLVGCVGMDFRYDTKTETCSKNCKIKTGVDGYSLSVSDEFTAPKNDEIISRVNMLKYLGAPSKIEKNSSEEIWIYNEKRWVGIMAYVVIPIPLMLPVKNDEVSVIFQGNSFHRLVQKSTVDSTKMCSILPVGTDDNSFCWSKGGVTHMRFNP